MRPIPSRLLLSTFLATASLLLPPWGFAGAPSEKSPSGKEILQIAEAHPMYLGTINTGIKTNDSYTDGNFSIVAPVWSSLGAEGTLSGGVLFLEPYISYGEGGEVAASLGLGYRHLFGTQSVSALTNHDGHQAGFFEEGAFIGANLFVDMLDTEANNQFWQLGVGLEAGTRYVELRGNYYIPLSDKQLAEERRSRETFRTTSSSTGGGTSTSVTPLGDPFATGNTVSQDALFTNYDTRFTQTTTTTTTIERLFQRFEEGMEGWDAEIAVLVPGIDRYMDVMLIGGYYSFDNQPFGPQQGGTGDVEGWKAGIEVRPVPALVLSGTWYEDERLTGSDWTAGVQIQVPFELGDLGDGKGFWDRIGDAFTPRRRHLMERLAEPVGRQNAAVKIANSFKDSAKVVSQTSSTKVQRSAARVVSQTAQRIVLADDIVFVNNGGDVGNGIAAGDTQANGADGTAELAYDSIGEGAAKAGMMSNNSGRVWKVYTQGGTGLDYSGLVLATGSTRFISSFTPLVALGNTTFGGGTDRPVLNGNIFATSIPVLQVTGYDLRSGLGAPTILALNVQELQVTSNITSGGSGVTAAMFNGGTSTVNVSSNQMTGPSGTPTNGIDIVSRDGSTINTDIRDNQLFGDFDDGIFLGTEDTASIDGTVANNILSGTYRFDGIDIDHSATTTNTVEVVNNILPGTFGSIGIHLMAEGETNASVLNANVQGNILNGTYPSGVTLSGLNAARNVSTVQGNLFSGSFAVNGVYVQMAGTSQSEVNILNNTFSGTFARGVAAFGTSTGTAGATVQGNTFSGAFDRGVNVDGLSGSTLDIDVVNNTFSGTFGTFGVRYASTLTGPDTTQVRGTVSGNVLSGVFTTGINVAALDGSVIEVDVLNNALSGTFTTGIWVERRLTDGGTLGKLRSDIVGNQLTGNFQIGIRVDDRAAAPVDASFIAEVDVSNNVLISDLLVGISIYADNGSQLKATVGNNVVTVVNEGSPLNLVGISLGSSRESILTVSGFNGNVVSGPWQTAIELERGVTGSGGAVIVNGTLDAAFSNQVSGELGDKLDINNPFSEPITGSFYLNGNLITLPTTVP